MKRALIIIGLLIIFIAGLIGGSYIGEDGIKIRYKTLQANYEQEVMLNELGLEETKAKYDLLITKLDRENKVLIQELARTQDQPWGKESLRDFRSLEELMGFLSTQKVWNLPYEPEDFVCSHFGFELMKNGAAEGYRLYPALIYGLQYNTISSLHMTCFAVVDEWDYIKAEKAMYLIDPTAKEFHRIGLLYDEDTWETSWYTMLDKLFGEE